MGAWSVRIVSVHKKSLGCLIYCVSNISIYPLGCLIYNACAAFSEIELEGMSVKLMTLHF